MVIELTIFVIAGIALAELGSRWKSRRNSYYVRKPGAVEVLHLDRDTHPTLPSPIHFTSNKFGFRATSDKSPMIMCAGGSAIECYILDDKDSWPCIIEQELTRARMAETPVANIGRAGVDSLTLLKMLERMLPFSFNLQYMIIMVGPSDIVRWLEDCCPRDRACTPLPVSSCFSIHPEMKFGLHPRRWAIKTLLGRLKDGKFSERYGALKWYANARKMRRAARTVIEEVPDHSHVTLQFEESLSKIIQLLRKFGIQPICATQPWFNKQEYSSDELATFWHGGLAQAFRGQVDDYVSEQVINALMQSISSSMVKVAQQTNCDYIDLRNAVPNELDCYMDQIHFAPRGAEFVGKALASKIIELEKLRMRKT